MLHKNSSISLSSNRRENNVISHSFGGKLKRGDMGLSLHYGRFELDDRNLLSKNSIEITTPLLKFGWHHNL